MDTTKEFKPGDRVVSDAGTAGVLALAEPDIDGDVVVRIEDGGHYAFIPLSKLSLIPQTVTVTVELPRGEADWVAQAFTLGPDGYDVVGNKVSARLAAAVREALQ